MRNDIYLESFSTVAIYLLKKETRFYLNKKKKMNGISGDTSENCANRSISAYNFKVSTYLHFNESLFFYCSSWFAIYRLVYSLTLRNGSSSISVIENSKKWTNMCRIYLFNFFFFFSKCLCVWPFCYNFVVIVFSHFWRKVFRTFGHIYFVEIMFFIIQVYKHFLRNVKRRNSNKISLKLNCINYQITDIIVK